MIYLDDNTKRDIEKAIKEITKNKLLDGFKNRNYQTVASIEDMIIEYSLNEEKSNRNILMVEPVIINTRVFVNLRDNLGQATNWLTLRINSIEFSYNDNSNNFVVSANQEIGIIDMTI
ncbi:hypothetical protein [Flavobacterium tyrosinilyticum]|uniref:hypothetical protein n=1 Tax=Flavobacterium tyrosinilyticum TaxID=1658740 RepID=UPI00202FA24E|nr:hypothetical protein [Flavobacterium tyrosinilyticum]MCM0666223.1 hypothetical protein [Flavobacterium tyrosinilyticum]